MDQPIYLNRDAYNQYVAEVAKAMPPPLCPFTGKPSIDAIKIMVGERLNIWPASLKEDEDEE